MPLSDSQAAHLTARLTVIEKMLQIVLEILPAHMAEGAIENMSLPERKFLREQLALYKTIIQTLRAKGDTASKAGNITRQDVGKMYFDAQTAMGRVEEVMRKLRARAHTSLEDAPITAAQRAIWETKATEALTELDAEVGGFVDE
ncbi:hypothetical protein LCGC14_0948710 [marine sediment metagenome]|uniref:Uncharacterized protein n=1 Tax=marine sediment metagenome TaxID=412755 RepID=A0A0F9RPD0_9ZZZZ